MGVTCKVQELSKSSAFSSFPRACACVSCSQSKYGRGAPVHQKGGRKTKEMRAVHVSGFENATLRRKQVPSASTSTSGQLIPCVRQHGSRIRTLRSKVDTSRAAMSLQRHVATPASSSGTAADSQEAREVYPGIREAYWTWRGHRIRYHVSGTEGDAIVLVHGFGKPKAIYFLRCTFMIPALGRTGSSR